MKRTYKILSLVYLIVMSSLIFQGQVRAMEEEGGEKPTTTTTESSKETGTEITPPPDITGQADKPLEPSSGTPELEEKQTDKPEEESSEVARLGEPTEKGPSSQGIDISVTELTVAQVREVWNNLRTLLESMLDLVRVLVPQLRVQYSEEEGQAMDKIFTSTVALVDKVNSVLAGIDNGTINQKNVHEQLESILSVSRDFANTINTARAQNPGIAKDRYLARYEQTVNVAVGDAVGQLGRLFASPVTVK